MKKIIVTVGVLSFIFIFSFVQINNTFYITNGGIEPGTENEVTPEPSNVVPVPAGE